MVDDTTEHGASIIPFGLAVLSIATFLMGFAAIFQSRAASAPYFMSALLFGGIGEFLAGMWAFAYREPIVATIFSFLGLFYGWFGVTNLALLRATPNMANVSAVSMGMVLLVAGVITLYLWLSSFSEPPGLILTLLFLWISFMLFGVALFTGLIAVRIVGGGVAIVSSLIAAVASFTDLHRRAGLGEAVMVDELATKAREKLAEKIRPKVASSGSPPRQTEPAPQQTEPS